MGDAKQRSAGAKAELLAFHDALVRHQKEAGTLGTPIPMRTWEAMLAEVLGTMTRQTCHDKTWAMQALQLIHKADPVKEGKNGRPTASIIVLEKPT